MSIKHSSSELSELMPMLTWASMLRGVSPRAVLAEVSPNWDKLTPASSVIAAIGRLVAKKSDWTKEIGQQADLDLVTDEPIVQLAYMTMLAIDEPPTSLAEAALQWQTYLQLRPELFRAPSLGDEALLILSALTAKASAMDRYAFINFTDAVQTKLSILLDQVKQYYYNGGEE